MNMYEIIQKKKAGKALSPEEIAFFIRGFTSGSVPDYQASALLMALCLKGMTEEETGFLTEEMMRSGDVLDLSELGEGTVDKHSTGGVGDKTTLIAAPIAAAAGATIAKMSGRGLGHTGGTVDKLESIPGFRADLSSRAFFNVAKQCGISLTGQSASLAPADKKLYALRDVTATVDSIPLIASSVMSKKLASGSKNLVLDVKYGSGAFMKTPEEAVRLAEEMVSIGERFGRRVVALVTDMDAPLGTHIGNALEVKEAVETLRGKGDLRLTELCLALSSHMISLAARLPLEKARERAQEVLKSGEAFLKMKEWISSQGGDAACLEDPSRLPQSAVSCDVLSPESGYLFRMDTEKIGLAAGDLGAGRKTKEDAIDPGAGIVLRKTRGDKVKKGEVLATLYTSDRRKLKSAGERFLSALTLSSEAPEKRPVVFRILGKRD